MYEYEKEIELCETKQKQFEEAFEVPEIEESDEVSIRVNLIIEKVRNLQESINYYAGRYIALNNSTNVGIQFSNKMIEVKHQFNNAGIDFIKDSTLRAPITNVLLTKLEEGINLLRTFDLQTNTYKKMKKSQKRSIARGFYNQYKTVNDEIWSFDLESEIVSIILEESLFFDEYPHLIGPNGWTTYWYEKELKALGYEHLINVIRTVLKDEGLGHIILDETSLSL